MLKREHISTGETGDFFSELKYLLSYNPDISIDNISTNVNNDLKYLYLLEELEKIFGKLKHIIYSTYSNDSNTVLVNISWYRKYKDSKDKIGEKHAQYLWIHYVQSQLPLIDKYKKELEPNLVEKDEKETAKFYLVAASKGAPTSLVKYLDRLVVIDAENSYNLNVPFNTLLDDIKSNKSGLIIYGGEPGGGKTTLIKYLAQEISEKKFYYIPNTNLAILSDPGFITFCFNNLRDSVLVLEDCERILLSRSINKSHDISNVLNITDGIMGDLLNMKIIATLNTTDKIDEALLRKGRLIRKVDFNKLKVEQVTNLAKTLNKDITPREMMLCELYNTEENGVEAKQEIKLGFN